MIDDVVGWRIARRCGCRPLQRRSGRSRGDAMGARMKYSSKQDLLTQIETEHARFVDLIDALPTRSRTETGVWGEDWTAKDLVAHLTEWEQMFLRWHRAGLAGKQPQMPAPGYKWSETPRLNHEIWRRHKDASWKRTRAAFDASYQEILALAKSLREEELLEPGRFAWTKKNPLTTYLGANTASHYRTAVKIIKRWQRRSSG
jgi:hypothetical protein